MKGVTKACPNCKEILVRYINITGEGTFELKCNSCRALVEVTIGKKIIISTIIKATLLIILIIGLSSFITFKSTQLVLDNEAGFIVK